MPNVHDLSVAVLTPTTGLCRMGYAQSLARLVAYFSQVRVFPESDKQNLITDSVEGSGIAENYERMVRKYLADTNIHWTHFLSVEDDMAFPYDGLHRLARHNLPIVGANYCTNKGSPMRFTAAGMTERCLTTSDSTGLEEVSLLPQGFTLVAREVYETLHRPWFLMGYNQESGNYVYQDYYFSEHARKHGYKLYVDHDVSKDIRHIGVKTYTYEDALPDEIELLNKGILDNGNSRRSVQSARNGRQSAKQVRGSRRTSRNGCAK